MSGLSNCNSQQSMDWERHVRRGVRIFLGIGSGTQETQRCSAVRRWPLSRYQSAMREPGQRVVARRTRHGVPVTTQPG